MLWRVPVRSSAFAGLGQIGQSVDPCIEARKIPVLNEIMSKFGCSTGGRALAKVAIQVALSTQLGPSGAVIGQIGSDAVLNCLCNPAATMPPIILAPPPPPVSIWKNPMLLVGMAAAIAGGYAFYEYKKKPRAVAAPPPPPSAPEHEPEPEHEERPVTTRRTGPRSISTQVTW